MDETTRMTLSKYLTTFPRERERTDWAGGGMKRDRGHDITLPCLRHFMYVSIEALNYVELLSQ